MATMGINPLFMGVLRSAQVILARTSDTAAILPTRYAGKVRVVLETAVADEWLAKPPVRPAAECVVGPVHVIYTGRLVAFKNVAVAILALSLARKKGVDLRLSIVGDGPQRPALQALAEAEGIGGLVTFTGMVTQAQVLAGLQDSDIYLLPSLREGGVWSLMEAMALGLPVVCVNTSGMAVIADAESAILVEPHSQQQMIDDFADALIALAKSPERREQLGRKARQRIETHFRWQHKGEFMQALFTELERDRP
jgi:glycosyltransferase involved in cell wall biosynthesis